MKTSSININSNFVETLKEYEKLNRICNIKLFVGGAIADAIFSLEGSKIVERYKNYCKRQIKNKYREKEAELILNTLFYLEFKFIEDTETLNKNLLKYIEELLKTPHYKGKYDFDLLAFFLECCERFAKNYEEIRDNEEWILRYGARLNSEELKKNAFLNPFDDEDFLV